LPCHCHLSFMRCKQGGSCRCVLIDAGADNQAGDTLDVVAQIWVLVPSAQNPITSASDPVRPILISLQATSRQGVQACSPPTKLWQAPKDGRVCSPGDVHSCRVVVASTPQSQSPTPSAIGCARVEHPVPGCSPQQNSIMEIAVLPGIAGQEVQWYAEDRYTALPVPIHCSLQHFHATITMQPSLLIIMLQRTTKYPQEVIVVVFDPDSELVK